MYWRDLLNVQNVEKGFFRSSNSYGIPDIKKDEFEIKELIPYRVDSNRNGTAHFFLDDYRFERCWKWADSQIPELRKYDGVLSPDFSTPSYNIDTKLSVIKSLYPLKFLFDILFFISSLGK